MKEKILKILCVLAVLVISKNVAGKTDFYKQLNDAIKKINNAIVLTKLAIGRDPKAKDVPDRYMSLAELYLEKAKYLYYMEQEEKVINEEDEIDLSLVNENRKQAISIYQLLLDNFKDYPNRDRILILLANEYNEIEDKKSMIETFKRLLREFPNTPYQKEGNLVLGDHYYDEHNMSAAISYYKKVASGKKSAITFLAYYKLAWCYINLEKFRTALDYFEKVLLSDIEIISDSPFIKRSANVKGEALIDSILCYTNLKDTKASHASEYYFKLAPTRALYIKVLDKLANRYFTGGEYTNAVIIYRKLITITNNVEKTLLYTSRIWKLLKHLKGTQDVGQEALLLSRHLLRYKNSWRLPEKDREKFIVDYEMYMRHISTLADKSYRGLKKTKVKGKMRRAHRANVAKSGDEISIAYKAYLQSFPTNKRYNQIRQNYSQVLYEKGDMLKSGKVFEEISNTDPSIRNRKNSLRTAMYSYDMVLKNEDETLYNKVWARAGIKDLSTKYLKYYPNSRKAPELTFNIARLTFEQGAQEEGIEKLYEFMTKYPKSAFVPEAGHKILDYHNMRTDYKGLVGAAKKILAVPGVTNRSFRKQVQEIADSAIKAEVAEQTEALATAETADDFFVVADKFKGTSIGAESLYNAFNVARLKKDHFLILAAGQKMLKEYPKNKNIKTVKLALADTYLQNLQFVRAAEIIEDAYGRYPNEKGMTKLLENAADIYSLLAEYQKANALYAKLRARNVRNSNQLLYKIAENQYNAQMFDRALSSYLTYNKRINSVVTNVKVARTFRAMGKTKSMIPYYKKAASICGRRCMSDMDSRKSAAEAKYYLIEERFKNYINRRVDNRNLDRSINAISSEFQVLEKAYGEVVAMQDPTWAIAGILRLGKIYEKMASFLNSARPPTAYNKAQKREFQKLMKQKVGNLSNEAKNVYRTCNQKSYDFNLFSEHAYACYMLSRGRNYKVHEKYLPQRRSKSFRGKDIHMKLLHKPFDIDLMQDLAEIYYSSEDYYMAKLISLKILERKKDNDVLAILGNSYLNLGEEQIAYETFKKVLISNPNQKNARNGLKSLYNKYGNPKVKGL